MLVVELVALFVVVPLAYLASHRRFSPLPLLWAAAAYAWWRLAYDGTFDTHQLWNAAPLGQSLRTMLPLFALGFASLWAYMRVRVPHMLWNFPRRHFGRWAMLMALYPVLSVYPQALVYRAFFLHRYAVLFPGAWWPVLASAALFAWMHIIFRNRVAVVLTFAGGLLFAWRYEVTGSLLVSSVEHALYGCSLFTLGLGRYFYHDVWPGEEDAQD